MHFPRKKSVVAAVLFFSMAVALGQAGRRPEPAREGGVLLNVTAVRSSGSPEPVTSRQISLYDNGIEQTIKNLSPDPSPARIVLLVDNSLTLRADIDRLEQAAKEFAYEIYEGDKLLIVGYDEEAEIVADWTDDAKSIDSSLKGFRKKGQPHLFDALAAVNEQALAPLSAENQKRIIVVISDGLDRGSKSKFNDVLTSLQKQDITVYALQAPDRTGGALRRDQPKAPLVIEKLAEGTGGKVFSIKEPENAAKAICDELRKNRYILSYSPSSVPYGEARRLLILGSDGVVARAKSVQPGVAW